MDRNVSTAHALTCLLLTLIPGWVRAEPVEDERAVLEFLQQAFQANISRLKQGRVTAEVSLVRYDPDGRRIKEDSTEATIAFKDQKSRLEWKGRWAGIEDYLLVCTEEVAYSYFPGDTYVYADEPTRFRVPGGCDEFVPSKSAALAYGPLAAKMADDNVLLSRKIERGKLNGRDIYVIDVTWKKRPQDLYRYHVDPIRGAAVLKWEHYTDFGNGQVRTVCEEAEMQPTSQGDWYVKRSTRTDYQRDGKTLREKILYDIKESDFVSKVSDEEFTLQGMGLPPGTKLVDKRLGGIVYSYNLPEVVDETINDILDQPLVKETVSPVAGEPIVVSREAKDDTGAPVAKASGTEGGQAVSDQSVARLLGVAGLAVLVTILVLVIRRHRTQVGDTK